MATKAAAAVKDAVVKARPNFPVGHKQVFLPNHVITMLPPKKILSPFFATFQVPLRFNKLDLRDYLFHAYGVEVRKVRSWLTPQAPRRRYSSDADNRDADLRDVKSFGVGPWYRPQPIKRMMVELVKPFVFPQPPPRPTEATRGTADDPRAPWDYDMHSRVGAQRATSQRAQQAQTHDRVFALRDEEEHVPAFRVGLAKQARALVRGEQTWQSTAKLDERWNTILRGAGKAGTAGKGGKAKA